MEDILLLVASSSNFPRIRFQSVDFPHTFKYFPNIRLSILNLIKMFSYMAQGEMANLYGELLYYNVQKKFA